MGFLFPHLLIAEWDIHCDGRTVEDFFFFFCMLENVKYSNLSLVVYFIVCFPFLEFYYCVVDCGRCKSLGISILDLHKLLLLVVDSLGCIKFVWWVSKGKTRKENSCSPFIECYRCVVDRWECKYLGISTYDMHKLLLLVVDSLSCIRCVCPVSKGNTRKEN